jgi:hypothetical protein
VFFTVSDVKKGQKGTEKKGKIKKNRKKIEKKFVFGLKKGGCRVN